MLEMAGAVERSLVLSPAHLNLHWLHRRHPEGHPLPLTPPPTHHHPPPHDRVPRHLVVGLHLG